MSASCGKPATSNKIGSSYRSKTPPLVRQSKAHREMVTALLPLLPRATQAAQRAIEKLGVCGIWNGVSLTPAGFPVRYRCGLHVCCHCGGKWKTRTAAVLAGEVRRLSDPDFGNVRRVTLNLGLVPEQEVARMVESQRAAFTEVFKYVLPDFALVGGFDFALKSAGRVMVHIHGVLVGPPGGLPKAEQVLKAHCVGFRSFSSDQLRARLETGQDGPTTWMAYALDSAITAAKHNRRPDWDHHSLTSPEEKFRWVHLHTRLKNRTGNPIRVTVRFGSRRMLNRRRRDRTVPIIGRVGLTENFQTRGETYQHLFRQGHLGRASEPSRRSGGGCESPAGPGDDPADVRHTAAWAAPARGPPGVRSGCRSRVILLGSDLAELLGRAPVEPGSIWSSVDCPRLRSWRDFGNVGQFPADSLDRADTHAENPSQFSKSRPISRCALEIRTSAA
jgi:hypothetical protein